MVEKRAGSNSPEPQVESVPNNSSDRLNIPTPEAVTAPLPGQDYKVVCIALDLTGMKLIDEVCHIAAYCHPDKSFSQYVMPHRDISRSAARTFGIRIFTNFGRFRALKDMKTLRTLKTKSEYSALTDFMEWLKEMKGSSDGLLLAYHDNKNQTVTPFLIEALERYKMTNEFFEVVKGFICCQDIAEDHPECSSKTVTIRALSKQLLQLEDKTTTGGVFHSAKDRAQIVYQLLQKLQNSDKEIDAGSLLKYVSTREKEMENLDKQRIRAQKVRSLRPIFAAKIRRNVKERSRAVYLRKFLIEAEVELEDLKKAFELSRDKGITEIVEKTSIKKKEKDMQELVDMIIAFFKDDGTSKRDLNGNVKKGIKKLGEGDGQPNGATTSSTETDEDEFEEAKEGIENLDINKEEVVVLVAQ